MRYFRNKCTKEEISLEDMRNRDIIESQFYQDYLRNSLIDTKEEKQIDVEHLENIFTNEIYYRAMKNLLPIEKKVLYLSYYENWTLGEVCKILKKSKAEIIKIKSTAITHFKKNVKKYELIFSKKKGGVDNG